MARKERARRVRPPKVSHLKPDRFSTYLTIGELSDRVNKDVSWLRKLERAGRIPSPRRVNTGSVEVRLYSPAQVDEIAEILSKLKRGRPRGSR